MQATGPEGRSSEVMSSSLGLIATALLLAVGGLYLYAKYRLSYWRRRGVKSFPSHMLFGNFGDVFTMKQPPGQVVKEIYERCEPDERYCGFYTFHQPKLLIRDLGLVKQVMVKDFEVFPNRCFGGDSQKDSVGLVNLLAIHQPRWKYLRSKITPSVTGLKLRKMIPLIEACQDPLFKFMERVEKDADGWATLELKDISSRYTTDIIASLAFGITTNSFSDDNVSFWEAGQKILSGTKRGLVLITVLYLPGLIKFIEKIMAEPTQYFKAIFWDSMNTREKNNIKRPDLIDYFINLKNDEQNPDYRFDVGDNLLSQAVSFYVAGFETTSTSIAFSLYELSRHPEDEERLYREITETLAGREANADLIMQMPFLDAVVKETLRLYPPLPILDHVAAQNYKLPGTELVIEKGTNVFVSVAGINRDPKYFENPNEFVPSRLRVEAEDHPSDSLPFGLGPRSCVGQRLGMLITKMAVMSIVKEFKLSNDKLSETEFQNLTIFTAAADGVYVKLRRRNS